MVTIADIMSQWQSIGVFDYILPFLLIFSVVFGILTSTNIVGKHKGVHVIIAIVIGLLALRLGFVQMFFLELFPRLGVGLAVILALMIMTGLFITTEEAKYWSWGIAVVAVVIWLIILVGTSQSVGWFGSASGTIGDYAGLIIGAILLVGVIIAVVAAKGPGNPEAGKASRKEW